MECQKSKRLLDVYVDGELDAGTMVELDVHVESCEACRALVVLSRRLKSELRSLSTVRAPDSLARAVEKLARRPRRMKIAAMASLPPLAAAAAVALFLFSQPSSEVSTAGMASLVSDVVERHVGNLPMEVTQSDPNQVAAWFDRKVSFPVRAPALGLRGASLEGGRISNVRDRQAAHINYQFGGHRVSMMIFNPDQLDFSGGQIVRAGERDVWVGRRNGYNVAIVIDNDMAYAISSDLSQKQLVEIAGQLFR